MYIFPKKQNLRLYLDTLRADDETIAFVPTMGALHAGHLSLVEAATERYTRVVVSIFVNPTQFNDPGDLARYPRPLADDLVLLNRQGLTTAVFVPSTDEMYPAGRTITLAEAIDFSPIDDIMEGAHRPGHFAGVAQVVGRLLDAVRPDALVMGQKDLQQTAIVRHLLKQQNRTVELLVHPTQREASGLALSSRNRLLDEADRAEAAVLARALRGIDRSKPLTDELDRAKALIEASGRLRVEYLEAADAERFLPVANWNEAERVAVCVAAHIGGVRLIDNAVFDRAIRHHQNA